MRGVFGMNAFISLVGEVEAAVSGGDSNKRVETLRRMTGLFVDQAPHLQEQHVTVFDEVILRLARNLEFRARVELAERMADIENAPFKVTRDLAFDTDISVAGPILERSLRLNETDLVEIAQNHGQDHLLALSRRSILSEIVTDILVDRGDERVVKTVAGNSGARFSQGGFGSLLERARGDESLQGILRQRRDIPPNHLARLVEIAREKVRETLKNETGDKNRNLVDATIDDVAHMLAAKDDTKSFVNNFDAAEAFIKLKMQEASLTEADVIGYFNSGKTDEALVAIAHLAGVPVDMVARAYHATSYDPLLFIIRSIKFSWGGFKIMLTAKAGRMPPLDVLKTAFDSYQQLTVATAQRVVRFTAAREKAASSEVAA
jgi:uncharacterized protein (DUF2336 family)